jgi:hypothetical protein
VTDSDSRDPVEDDWTADDEPELIVCPQCAHPNLAFRTHCRRCSGRLTGATNLIPGAELIEWSPTDGSRSPSVAIAPLRVLMMMAALFGLMFTAYAIQVRSVPGIFIGVTPLIAAALIEARIRAMQSAEPEAEVEATEPSLQCPECGEGVEPFDDVCLACGAILVEAPPGLKPDPPE